MSAAKDDYGFTANTSASLLTRLRDIDNQYLMRAYDHATLKRAQDFIRSIWEMYQRGELDTAALEKLLAGAKLV